MDMSSLTPSTLRQRIGGAGAPVLVDVRRDAAFAADTRMIAGALRGAPEQEDAWGPALPAGRPVVVYCVHGHEVGQEAAARLRALGVDALYLEGGIEGAAAAGVPIMSRWPGVRGPGEPPTRRVTRARPKVDRIACPWLVRRFIDPEAAILYVPADEVAAVAAAAGAIPFDLAGVEYGHVGEECSIDAFLRRHGLADPALHRLAAIVRGADTGRPALAPEAAGLLAISLGLSTIEADDAKQLTAGIMLYDALYAWARGQDGGGRG